MRSIILHLLSDPDIEPFRERDLATVAGDPLRMPSEGRLIAAGRPCDGIRIGSPVLSTTTVLGLALATAAINASWLAASELTSAALAAPLSSAKTKATLAELAATTAALIVSPSRDQANRNAIGWINGTGTRYVTGCAPVKGTASVILIVCGLR